MRQIKPGKPLNLAGGRIVVGKPEPIVIEVAIIDDRDGVLYGVLANEVTDHMVLPMSLLLVFVLGARPCRSSRRCDWSPRLRSRSQGSIR